jgi:hypothetical protein
LEAGVATSCREALPVVDVLVSKSHGSNTMVYISSGSMNSYWR